MIICHHHTPAQGIIKPSARCVFTSKLNSQWPVAICPGIFYFCPFPAESVWTVCAKTTSSHSSRSPTYFCRMSKVIARHPVSGWGCSVWLWSDGLSHQQGVLATSPAQQVRPSSGRAIWSHIPEKVFATISCASSLETMRLVPVLSVWWTGLPVLDLSMFCHWLEHKLQIWSWTLAQWS